MITAEMQLLADAILRHWPFALDEALRRALWAVGEYVTEKEERQCQHYAESIAIAIAMVPNGFHYVHRDGAPLLGLGSLEISTKLDNPQLLTRCTAWYGVEALAECLRRDGASTLRYAAWQ